ncbi:MAG: zinc-finger domain-containing protein [Gammaproteobacteria bacterium]|nr:zinc-finger domain-containing protein [Gammaproteobacteria bacterium]MBL7000399.1 zinc-finger domain-containing protein [Gammaproteobacteria bacterium]
MVNPNTAAKQQDFTTPNSKTAIQLKTTELPVHCPAESSSLWNSHPKVYIPVAENGGEAKCPYCGTLYKLID